MREVKRITESEIIKLSNKIISERVKSRNLIKVVLEQSSQEISVKNITGKLTKYKNDSPEYSKLFYSPEFKAYYIWKDGMYQVDDEKWGKYNYNNWDSRTAEEKKLLINKAKGVVTSPTQRLEQVLGKDTMDKIKNFNPLSGLDLQSMVDWIVWILKCLGPQGKILATLGEVAQGLAYVYQAYKSTDLYNQVTNFFEGFNQFFSIANVKIKTPGTSNLIGKVVKYFEKFDGSQLSSKYGNKFNELFNQQPKWKQCLITILVKVAGDVISTTFDWIKTNLLDPLYNMIKDYNQTMANYLLSFIQTIKTFISFIETAKLIINDFDTK
jgi:hypothetical protein